MSAPAALASPPAGAGAAAFAVHRFGGAASLRLLFVVVLLRVACLVADPTLARPVGNYIKVVNGRCSEFEEVYPLGEDGVDWDEDMHERARKYCDKRKWCVGYMRYTSDNPVHCHIWCGRPQFCNAMELTGDDRWSSYLKENLVRTSEGLEDIGQGSLSPPPPSTPLPYDVACPWPHRASTRLFFQLPTGEGEEEDWGGSEADRGDAAPCRVLYHEEGQPLPDLGDEGLFDGVLSEDLAVVPFFAAVRGEGGGTSGAGVGAGFGAGAGGAGGDAQGPWRFAVERNEYLEPQGVMAKRHYLSVFFLSEASRCDGKESAQWGPEEAEQALPGHVFVDDGTLQTRQEAFKPYHFSVICGSPEEASFVPQAVVDAIACAVHPLVLRDVHKEMHRAFFHLPDALQAYIRIHPTVLAEWVKKLYNDPAKNTAMYYQQTFMFLMQNLFRYRYREQPRARLEAAACCLCEERARRRRAAAAAAADGIADGAVAGAGGGGGEGGEGGGGSGDDEALSEAAAAAEGDAADDDRGDEAPTHGVLPSVGIAVCVMSRRSGHILRTSIRETWAQHVLFEPGAALRFFVGRRGGRDWEEEEELGPLEDLAAGDVVELDAPESYKAVTLKAFSMIAWAYRAFPNLRFLVRADDDVYLRPGVLFGHLERRAPVAYLWGNFDHGSNPIRDPLHQHYNSYAQFPEVRHPLFGDIFPPYARGHLWAMSFDLVARVAEIWLGELARRLGGAEPASAVGAVTMALARELPHPDDPAIGVTLASLVEQDGLSINIDDRDLNVFALNPSCNATYLGLHNRAWAVHHVTADDMRCMWNVDEAARAAPESKERAPDRDEGTPSKEGSVRVPVFPDLCGCGKEVDEEVMEGPDEEPFDYPRERFHDGG